MSLALADVADFYPDIVVVRRPTGGLDTYGRAKAAKESTYPAHITGSVKNVVDFRGNEAVSSYKVYLLSADLVNPESEIVLPERFSPRSPKILTTRAHTDENGPHHTVVVLG